jgi:hypothetical protein
LFKCCFSLLGFILLFPPGASSSSLEFSPRANKGLCLCCEDPCPLNADFGLYKDHYYFANFSSSRFILAMFKFCNGVPTKNKLGFYFKHV